MAKMRLPEEELEIMQIIWQLDGEVSTMQIMEGLKGKKSWRSTTALNLLARMVTRGFLTVRKMGNLNMYTALVAEEDYLRTESAYFLSRMHGNSLGSLLASLREGGAVTPAEADGLKDLIDMLAKEDSEK